MRQLATRSGRTRPRWLCGSNELPGSSVCREARRYTAKQATTRGKALRRKATSTGRRRPATSRQRPAPAGSGKRRQTVTSGGGYGRRQAGGRQRPKCAAVYACGHSPAATTRGERERDRAAARQFAAADGQGQWRGQLWAPVSSGGGRRERRSGGLRSVKSRRVPRAAESGKHRRAATGGNGRRRTAVCGDEQREAAGPAESRGGRVDGSGDGM